MNRDNYTYFTDTSSFYEKHVHKGKITYCIGDIGDGLKSGANLQERENQVG